MATQQVTQQAIFEGQVQDGGWQVVRRRRPYPSNWRNSHPSPPTTCAYQPFSRPTYAQVLLRNTPPLSTTIQPRATPPNSPTNNTTTTYYVSPHSPSRLRFPPSHTFSEWRGRCFRCCRTGYSAANCGNPKRCGRCWSFGHIGSKCTKEVIAPPPLANPRPPKSPSQCEPAFEELLTGPYPYQSPEMPSDRPMRLHCFYERDEEYFAELQRLKNAVVMHTKGFQWELSIDNVVGYACRTNLIKKEEIQVSELSGSRFFILLPEGLNPDTFINATPQEAWDEGLSFQPWSPLEDAGISIPAYKVLLRFVGVPPHLYREKAISQAVCRFGVYLGSVQPENPTSIASWIVAVGVDDLSLIPPQMVMHIGGMTHDVLIYTLAWKRAPIYTVEDMPKQPKIYHKPQPPSSSSSSSDDDVMHDVNDLIPMSSKVLRELCRGKTADSLPPELRRFATMEEIDLQHPGMTTQHHATVDPTAQETEFQANLANFQNCQGQRSPDIHDNSGMVIDVESSALVINAVSSSSKLPHDHSQSEGRFPEILEPNSNDLLLTVEDTQNTTSPVLVHVPVHVPQQTDLPAQVARKPPQKIILRGSSSGNNSHVIKPLVTAGQITRRIPTSEKGIITKASDRALNPGLNAPEMEAVQPFLLSNKLECLQGGQVRNFSSNSQVKNKGPLFKGPYASKYQWRKPTQTVPIISKKPKETVRVKRKNQAPLPGPVKKFSGKGKEKMKEAAEVLLNANGFYEVKVQYEHVSKLAEGCGFKNKDVENAIQVDNAQRETQAQENATESTRITDEDLDLGRFDPDSEDELSSEDEAC